MAATSVSERGGAGGGDLRVYSRTLSGPLRRGVRRMAGGWLRWRRKGWRRKWGLLMILGCFVVMIMFIGGILSGLDYGKWRDEREFVGVIVEGRDGVVRGDRWERKIVGSVSGLTRGMLGGLERMKREDEDGGVPGRRSLRANQGEGGGGVLSVDGDGDPKRVKVSAVVLFHNEYESLEMALGSWLEKGLIDYVDEVLFFLNAVKDTRQFYQRMPQIRNQIPSQKLRVESAQKNLRLGVAIARMVKLAKHPYILLMEKDWVLIEEQPIMKSRLDDAKTLVGRGIADVVRFRHRHFPGVPLHAQIMHQGREESIMRMQKNLLCYVHHWQKDPPNDFPGAGHMWRCGGEEFGTEEKDIFCASSKYCQWTNNPGLFKKHWFTQDVAAEYLYQYELERETHGNTSPFLDFEYYTNWRSYAWTDRNFTVALGTGLFEHKEGEQKYFNTFWYAHYRLTVDLEELRDQYLKNETRLKKLGMHYDSEAGPPPPNLLQRYPVDFVRKFQWDRVFNGTKEDQVALVDGVYNEFQQRYRAPKAANRLVPWRHYVTRLHMATEKAMMEAPPEQPHEMTITLVTCLLDIGRHNLGKDAYQFRRDFKIYLDAMADWLTHDYPKLVYTSKQIADILMENASEKVKNSTKFIYTTREELRTKWIGEDNYDKMQEIRLSKEWRARADWLSNSPQGGLKDYGPLVAAKMFMMRDASRQNPWNTTHFLFLDAKHNCRDPKGMTPKTDHILRAHMFDKFLVTYFDYVPNQEVHGFEYKAFNSYLNFHDKATKRTLKIGRGGIFGGSAWVLEAITAMYDVVLTATLREGLMGTEENILSILMYQVPQYIDPFSNDHSCTSVVAKDHVCKQRGYKNPNYNCGIIVWASRWNKS